MSSFKFSQYIKRHPLLYRTRFKLLSKNSQLEAIDEKCYNDLNPKSEIPGNFHDLNKRIMQGQDFEDDLAKLKHLCLWLRTHIKGGPGLSLASDQALNYMLAGKGGVCSDMVQVFNNFCVLNDLKVREWGMTKLPFDRNYGGHSLNEVYITTINKWVSVDVYLCILFYLPDREAPLSVIELDKVLGNHPETLKLECFTSYNNEIDKSIKKNYQTNNIAFFLICNYHNKTYDNYLKSLQKVLLPVFSIHFMLYLLNKSYYYVFPLDDYRALFKKV